MTKHTKEKVDVHTKETELKRTSHWWFSKRGPAFLDPLVHIGDHSMDIIAPYIHQGQIAADIGCGWGHYSFKLADLIGPEGKIYALDLAEKCVMSIQKKAQKRGYKTIAAHTSSAAEINFIKDASVDFVYANGLLCSMAIERDLAVSEMIRILKPTGFAYLSLGAVPPMGYVDEDEWKIILNGFTLLQGGDFKGMWALVSLP